jgi:hypothetical protein
MLSQPIHRLALPLTLLFLAFSLLPQIYAQPVLRLTFWSVGALLLLWQAALAAAYRSSDRKFEIEIVLRPQHYVQASVQFCIFSYWAWYWPPVQDAAKLILAQLVFAYVFDMLLSLTRGNKWTLGFGQFPVIFSINLFLWFKADWYYLQFLMIAIGILGRHFIVWNRDGRRTHIFNPSALSLSIFSLALLATGATDITWGRDLAARLFDPPHIFVTIFLVGLIVQYLFSVTLVTLASVGTMYLFCQLYLSITGHYFFFEHTNITVAVFLGMHLLVTDPATSPRTGIGRVIFGILYGAGVLVTFTILNLLGEPEFYDKLLVVPVLNLCVPLIERLVHAARTQLSGIGNMIPNWFIARQNLVHMATWSALFLVIVNNGDTRDSVRDPTLHQREDGQACYDGDREACERYFAGLINTCQSGQICYAAGTILKEGRLVDVDLDLARSSFERSCNFGFEKSCAELATIDRIKR